MADRDTPSMSKVLSNLDQELQGAPAPAPRPSPNVEAFAPQKYRSPSGASDSMEQIQQDFRKGVAELEQRYKALFDELKRITG